MTSPCIVEATAMTQSALLALELGLVPTFVREVAPLDAPTPTYTEMLVELLTNDLAGVETRWLA